MIETVMLVALGFTAASLIALLIAPALWRRAVRLTTRQIEATMPISVSDINADKDLLRAEYAVEMRRLELALDKAKERAARHLMERNQHMVDMGKLEAEITALKNTATERGKAGSVLEQTVQKRIPDLEQQLEQTSRLIAAREQELAERARAFENQTEALELAQKMIRGQEQEIDRLREALEAGGLPRWGKAANGDEKDAAAASETGKLQAELSRLREQLAQLQEVDAADSEELRKEMHRLADLMLSGKPAAKPRTRTARTRSSETGPAEEKRTTKKTAEKKPAARKKSAAAKRTTSARRSAKPRKSLGQRLAGLKGRKEKENA